MSNDNDLFEGLPGFIWRTSADGRLDSVSPGMREYIGAITDDLRRDWWGCVHPDDRAKMECPTTSSLISAEHRFPPVRIKRHDGAYRWFQCISREVRDERGVLEGLCSVGWDIHDSVRANAELRQRESEIRALVDCIPGFVWQLGCSGELQYLNTKVFEYTGKDLEGLREPGWRESVHPDDIESFIAHWKAAMQRTQPILVEFRLRRADGVYRWFRTSGAPIVDTHGSVVSWCGMDIDVDDEKRVDRSLRSAQSQLARTAQLAIAAELTASTANAINQPLAAIVANALACQRWLAKTPPDVARATPTLDLVVRDSNGVAAVVKRIMATIKGTPPKNSLLDVNEVIEEVLQLQAAEFQDHDIVVVKSLETGVALVHANAALLRQVLVNIIRNAIEALNALHLDTKTLSLSSRRETGELIVEVTDDGIGFLDGAPLFDAFYTTRDDGLGLGLAIARSIVEAYGGRVWALHNEPRGTLVGFSLPM